MKVNDESDSVSLKENTLLRYNIVCDVMVVMMESDNLPPPPPNLIIIDKNQTTCITCTTTFKFYA